MHELKQGQMFESSRGREYTIEHSNDKVVLLRETVDDTHRMESREFFEESIESGHFEPKEEIERIKQKSTESSESSSESIPFEDISWVGGKGAEALRAAGLESVEDIQRASDERLLQCNSVGETAVENIRDWIQTNE